MIKSKFTSTDLELITGVKSATLRMWERRYQIFSPEKKDRNIRYYSLDDTKKMLNVVFLNRSGYKISKIAGMSVHRINQTVREIVSDENFYDAAIKDLKIAMYHFDNYLFESAYTELNREKAFEDIFVNIFIPFLDFIGILWQTSAVRPAHEHFISNLIAQKILLKTAQIQLPKESETKYVLFLWSDEIHEIGLLYINYLLRKEGKQTIYLGRDVPLEDLSFVIENFNEIILVNYFTVWQSEDKVKAFEEFVNSLPKIKKVWGVGRFPELNLPDSDIVEYYSDIKEFSGKRS